MARSPARRAFDLSAIRYLQFDGTYFKHENCLMLLMDNATSKVIAHKYHHRENYESAYQMFKEMNDGDLNPEAITIDGNTSVIRALKAVWPDIIIQRCITHIQRQGLAWLRRYPKIQASKDLRRILLTITEVKDRRRRDIFITEF